MFAELQVSLDFTMRDTHLGSNIIMLRIELGDQPDISVYIGLVVCNL